MPRNGAGVYSLVNNTWFPPVNGVLATSTDWNTFISDVASALTQSVSSDGQTPMTGILAMGNNKITGLAPGTATTDAVNISQISSNYGQCRLVKNGANLLLQPFQGNRLTINGVVFTIPAAGVSLAPAGSVASTLYYIYAFMVGAVMTLEFSTTGHSTDAVTGVEIKTGDATRTLVGMARPVSGPAWQDTDAQRFVASWFNKQPKRIFNTNGSPSSTGSTTPVLIVPIMEFLNWSVIPVDAQFIGVVSNNTLNAINFTALGFDSATAAAHVQSQVTAYVANTPGTTSGGTVFLPNEGYHFISTVGSVSAGSGGTWQANIEHSGVVTG